MDLPTTSVALLYLGGLVRKKDADGNKIGEANMIFASPFFLDLAAWPIFAKNTTISAARVIDAAVKDGDQRQKRSKSRFSSVSAGKGRKAFALVDGESLIGWQ
jgi:hypothetical protein